MIMVVVVVVIAQRLIDHLGAASRRRKAKKYCTYSTHTHACIVIAQVQVPLLLHGCNWIDEEIHTDKFERQQERLPARLLQTVSGHDAVIMCMNVCAMVGRVSVLKRLCIAL